MPRFLFLLCLTALALLCWSCEEDPSETYSNDFLEAAASAPDGGYVLAGRSVRTDGSHEDADGYLVRLAANGGTVWERGYDLGPFGSLVSARVPSDESILAAGIYRTSDGANPLFLLKTAGDGALTWLRTPAVDSLVSPTAVRPTADGGFLFVGMTRNSIGTLRLVRCDAEANVTLDRTYYELTELICSDAVETSGGAVVLLCRLLGPNVTSTLYLIATGAGGDTLWTRALTTVNSYNVKDLLVELPNGEFRVARANDPASSGYGVYDIDLLHVSATGELITGTSYPLSETQVPLAMAPLADGGVVIAGLTRPETSSAQNFLVVRATAALTAAFTRPYDISAGDRATFVLPATDGGFLLGGYTTASERPGFDGCALKLDASGTPQWQRLFGQ